MKGIIKFLHHFVVVIFFYLFAYTTFTLFSITQFIEPYLIPILFIFAFTVYWFCAGIISPKHLIFFKTQNRLLILTASIITISILLCTILIIEGYVYKRKASESIATNVKKIVYVAKHTNPLAQMFKNQTKQP